MTVGLDTLFTKTRTTKFVVKNIAPGNKRIQLFNYPINNGQTRDLLAIPAVSEADIRHSLLKGSLKIKLEAKEITIVESNINLLQFDTDQKSFLQTAGITQGLEISLPGGGDLTVDQHKTLRQLIHLADGVGGPMEGFASAAYREILPLAAPFPTSIIWWESAAKTKKIIEKSLTYDGNQRITSTYWKVYDTDGITTLATITDTMSYSGDSPFEVSRTRVIS